MAGAIIVSKEDPAGLTIWQALQEEFSFTPLNKTFEGRGVFVERETSTEVFFLQGSQLTADQLESLKGKDFFVFASKHYSSKGIPALTAHPVGNWGKAEFGGRDFAVNRSSATLWRTAMWELQRQRDALGLEYEVALEATHHGPFLSKPVLFVELGSSDKQWRDLEGGRAVARAIMSVCRVSGGNYLKETGIALGGTHYGATFTRKLLSGECSFSHLAPKHALPLVTRETLAQALESSVEPVKVAYLDWKGLAGEKAKIVELCNSTGLEIVKLGG